MMPLYEYSMIKTLIQFTNYRCRQDFRISMITGILKCLQLNVLQIFFKFGFYINLLELYPTILASQFINESLYETRKNKKKTNVDWLLK